jgi:hypothetical protein
MKAGRGKPTFLALPHCRHEPGRAAVYETVALALRRQCLQRVAAGDLLML